MAETPRRFLIAFLSLGLSLLAVTIGIRSTGFQVQAEQVYATEEEPVYYAYLPIVQFWPSVSLTGAQTRNMEGEQQNIFYLWDTIQYAAMGVNMLDEAVSVDLTWTLDGPCGPTDVFSDTVILPAGEWEHTYNYMTPECNGAFTGTVQVNHVGFTNTLTTTYLVNLEQAFDRCGLPTVSEMQAWWDASPYTVWNIYLGGVHFACSLEDLTPEWVDSTAQQGWDFILTWVGPQAPCSTFHTTFSSNWVDAYFEGFAEAQDALAAADALGITGERIIYYDLEGYPEGWDNPACRYASAMFIQGWTQGLQDNGAQAGAYGSPCNSYMAEWASNQPPPDDVWIAHWLLPAEYRPDASVWDVSCMSNDYWPDHQRIRQYAGDHVETWGGIDFTIDSSVVDGETVTIPQDAAAVDLNQTPLIQRSLIRDVDLVSSDVGWALVGDRLLLTDDRGDQWRDATPDLDNGTILDAAFLDSEDGWAVVVQYGSGFMGETNLYHTLDGGITWDSIALPSSTNGISSAYLDFKDSQTGWLVLKLASGSSFSLGRMYLTQDGGNTWDERSVPMGEPAFFMDELRGWMVGGPNGDAVYRTLDGGLTWEAYTLQGLPDGKVYVGQPQFERSGAMIMPVTVVGKSETTLAIFLSDDDGRTWHNNQEVLLPSGFSPASAVPFHGGTENRWFAAADSSIVLGELGKDRSPSILHGLDLPPGTVWLDFSNESQGWALVQNGNCSGDKIPGYKANAERFVCNQTTRLYGTEDGGAHWTEIKLPGE